MASVAAAINVAVTLGACSSGLDVRTLRDNHGIVVARAGAKYGR